MATNKYDVPFDYKWVKPWRSEKNPIDSDEYPFGYLFPPWCHGGGVGIAVDAANTIYELATRVWRDFRIDDVLFFGIYRELAGLTLRDANPIAVQELVMWYYFQYRMNQLLHLFPTFHQFFRPISKR